MMEMPSPGAVRNAFWKHLTGPERRRALSILCGIAPGRTGSHIPQTIESQIISRIEAEGDLPALWAIICYVRSGEEQ
jgi:hypothetical protein